MGRHDVRGHTVSLRSDKDAGILAHSAMRYALGRRTYVVGDVCRILRDVLGSCDLGTYSMVRREIAEAIDAGQAGDSCDVAEWRALLDWMGT